MEKNILSLFNDDLVLDKESVERIRNILQEFNYATKYLSRNLKVRPFIVYLLLFKKAYFEVGQKKITVKLSDIGENLLSDIGKPMSHDVIKRGVNELVEKAMFINILENLVKLISMIFCFPLKSEKLRN